MLVMMMKEMLLQVKEDHMKMMTNGIVMMIVVMTEVMIVVMIMVMEMVYKMKISNAEIVVINSLSQWVNKSFMHLRALIISL